MNPHALRLVPPPPPPTEHTVWTLTKDARQAEARVRATPFGPELRILIDGELWWSQVVRPPDTSAVEAAAELKRLEFTAKGWALAAVVPPGRQP